jgi:4-hydroxybenzoyl-CoA thioesterase
LIDAPHPCLFIRTRVYLEDTDAGGIVYYVNYLRFMERARTEFLRSLGEDFSSLDANALKFVVYRVQVEYHSAARMDDELIVTARPVALARTNVVFEQTVERSTHLLCSGRIQVACVKGERMKPCAIPATLRQAFADAISAAGGSPVTGVTPPG